MHIAKKYLTFNDTYKLFIDRISHLLFTLFIISSIINNLKTDLCIIHIQKYVHKYGSILYKIYAKNIKIIGEKN